MEYMSMISIRFLPVLILASSITFSSLAQPTDSETTTTDTNVTAAAASSSITTFMDGVPTAPGNPTWGEFDPGKGFLVGRTPRGELSLSGYVLLRYLNQMPSSQNFVDHLGNVRPVDTREDFGAHRLLVWLKGWMYDPKLIYVITFWTVSATDQDAIFGNVGYQFDRKFNLYGGIAGYGGSRSLSGSHPYWLGHDRVMADEFFRPFFAQAIYANGELLPGFWYQATAGNNLSSLGVTASQLDRNQTIGGTVWWMPTTKEFGPRGAYGDYEMHEEVATRFGFGGAYSPEQRFTDDPDQNPQNTNLKLADGLNVFSKGSLAPDVTVENVDYTIMSVDAGVKYKGMFLQAEFYQRWLNEFDADGEIPVSEIKDNGFYVQASFFAIPKRIELYVATSQIYGDDGFGDSSEYLTGMNWYPFDTRDTRLNLQYIDVNHSPVGSSFGYYTAGQDGETVSVAYSLLF